MKRNFLNFFLQQQIVDCRAGAGAGTILDVCQMRQRASATIFLFGGIILNFPAKTCFVLWQSFFPLPGFRWCWMKKFHKQLSIFTDNLKKKITETDIFRTTLYCWGGGKEWKHPRRIQRDCLMNACLQDFNYRNGKRGFWIIFKEAPSPLPPPTQRE